ncbi:sulfite exporter TauE/SafE family protein [Oceanobacillus sp. FSL K6-2867]|uniref:sulfite exporter TauE/SafE family protein n=1 Tax=Oceanobacillus sp. FSL K6-2867 TaxID=2954748 RepID=UPI0030DC6D35
MEMIFIFIIYFVIGLLASTLGAVAGLGGGIIIKPVLDLFGHFDLPTIGVLSAATVLAMATMSLVKFRKKGHKTDKVVSSILAVGSIFGGILGKVIFNIIAISLNMPTVTGFIQSATLALLLTLIFIYFIKKDKLTSFVFKNRLIILTIGFILGFLSAFLGIGGGPLNVTILILLFSMNAKNAAINSIYIIFFSQLSALILIALTTGFSSYDLSMLVYMIIGGIIGGFIGSSIVIKMSNTQVEKIFNISILVIIFVNIYNIVNLLY